VDVWWQANERDLNKLDRLSVFDVPSEASRELALMAARTMALNVTIQEGQVFFSDEARVVSIELRPLKAVASAA
jgi:uncharacterized protein YaeQ